METDQPFFIWEGVYREWNEAPKEGRGFASPKWLASQVSEVESQLNGAEESHDLYASFSRDSVLAAVTATLWPRKSRVKILDFGGGLATTFFSLIGSLPDPSRVEFHVVENSIMCDAGERLFVHEHNLKFHTCIPVEPARFDVIHAARSLQYVEDWLGLLREFSHRRAEYVIFVGVLAGEIEPFVTVQNYYGSKIPVRFLNLDDFVQEMKNLEYQLLYKTRHISTRLGAEGVLPMGNFSKEHRIEYPWQLIFRREQRCD